jgi:hypothetical protein
VRLGVGNVLIAFCRKSGRRYIVLHTICLLGFSILYAATLENATRILITPDGRAVSSS